MRVECTKKIWLRTSNYTYLNNFGILNKVLNKNNKKSFKIEILLCTLTLDKETTNKNKISSQYYTDISQCNNGLHTRTVPKSCSDKQNYHGSEQNRYATKTGWNALTPILKFLWRWKFQGIWTFSSRVYLLPMVGRFK